MLIFADPCGLLYSTIAQAIAGLWQNLSATIHTSGLPAGNVGPTAMSLGVTNCKITVPNSAGPYIIGFRMLTTTLGHQSLATFFDSSNNTQVVFYTEANGTITAYRDGNLIGTSSLAVVLQPNVWSYGELQLSISASVGILGVRINGVSVLQTTADTKSSTANSTIGTIQI